MSEFVQFGEDLYYKVVGNTVIIRDVGVMNDVYVPIAMLEEILSKK